METYTSTLTLFTDSLTDSLICPHNALLSHLKLIPGSRLVVFALGGKISVRLTRRVVDYFLNTPPAGSGYLKKEAEILSARPQTKISVFLD